MSFIDKYGRVAIVTGGSMGIGKEFVLQLAQRGLDVIVIARGEEKLVKACEEISMATGRTITPISGDLADTKTIQAIIKYCAKLDVGLLVNNAVGGIPGAFLRKNEPDLSSVNVSITSPLILSHHFGRAMARRGRGGIMFVSGLSAYLVGPNVAAIFAANAYRVSLSESLHHELKNSGIDVSVLVPGGSVRTPGYADPNLDFSKVEKNPMEPDVVVKAALEGLGNKVIITPGMKGRVMGFMMRRVVPRAMLAKMMGPMIKKVIRKDLI